MPKDVIICVDDEKIVLNGLMMQLKRKFGQRFEYEFAESAEEAIELIEEIFQEGKIVKLIITDQIMPGMTGDMFLIHVHKSYPKPIKVLLTGQATLDSAVNAINEANLFRYIRKPWDEEDLILTVEKGLMQYDLVQTLEDQVHIFRKFVPKEFLDCLEIDDFKEIKAEKSKKITLTILFSDIKKFTTITEGIGPEKTFSLLNKYFESMGKCIKKHRGFIDKFLGDGVMALFPHSPEDAIDAAIAMQRVIIEFNESMRGANFPEVHMGVGINTGEVIIGTIGYEDRIDNTVIGDATNVAARIQNLNRIYDTSILITENTLNQIVDKSNYDIRSIDYVIVKGKTEPIRIFEVFSSDPLEIKDAKRRTKVSFERGLLFYYQRKTKEAYIAFKECLVENPKDTPSKVYLDRCEQLLQTGFSTDWTGVTSYNPL